MSNEVVGRCFALLGRGLCLLLFSLPLHWTPLLQVLTKFDFMTKFGNAALCQILMDHTFLAFLGI